MQFLLVTLLSLLVNNLYKNKKKSVKRLKSLTYNLKLLSGQSAAAGSNSKLKMEN